MPKINKVAQNLIKTKSQLTKLSLKFVPVLSNIALGLCTATGTSTKIETAFSLGGISFGARRTRLSSNTLENEMLIRYNKELL